LPSEALA